MPQKKFNLQRGIKALKADAKKMPKRVAKQLPNAALTLYGAGAAGAAVKGVKALKAAKAARIPRKIKVAGQAKKVKVTSYSKTARQVPRRTRPVKFKITRR